MILGCSPQTHLRHYWGMAADLRDRMVVSVPGFGTGVSGQSHKKNLFVVALAANQGVVFTWKPCLQKAVIAHRDQ